MSRWPPELTDVLEPGAEELRRAGQPPPPPGYCAWATEPSEGEIARLVARAGAARAPRRSLRPVLAVALVATLVLVGVLHLASERHSYPTGPATLVDWTLLRFGPSITVAGEGELLVLRCDRDGAEIELVRGHAVFEVDPHGSARHLEVLAGTVRVEVTGTRFRVAREGELVEVEVERGAVLVHRSEGSLALHADERWSVEKREPVLVPELGTAASDEEPEAVEPRPSVGAPASESPSPLPTPPHPPGQEADEPVDAALSWAAILEMRAHGAHLDELLAAVERFEASGPEPVLAAEAGAVRLELLAETLPGEEALPAIDAWLAAHPTHARALEIELLRATVAREQLGDCGLAIPSYARVAAGASGAMQAHAEAWLEHCRSEAR